MKSESVEGRDREEDEEEKREGAAVRGGATLAGASGDGHSSLSSFLFPLLFLTLQLHSSHSLCLNYSPQYTLRNQFTYPSWDPSLPLKHAWLDQSIPQCLETALLFRPNYRSTQKLAETTGRCRVSHFSSSGGPDRPARLVCRCLIGPEGLDPAKRRVLSHTGKRQRSNLKQQNGPRVTMTPAPYKA